MAVGEATKTLLVPQVRSLCTPPALLGDVNEGRGRYLGYTMGTNSSRQSRIVSRLILERSH